MFRPYVVYFGAPVWGFSPLAAAITVALANYR